MEGELLEQFLNVHGRVALHFGCLDLILLPRKLTFCQLLDNLHNLRLFLTIERLELIFSQRLDFLIVAVKASKVDLPYFLVLVVPI
jgi:hypothetical protein